MPTTTPRVHIALQDTGAMLDLYRADLVEQAFRLPVTYVTVEGVFNDLNTLQRNVFAPFIKTAQLQTVGMDAHMFATITKYLPLHDELSENDLAVYHLARKNNWPMVASCNTLRRCTQKLGIAVHSTYWVLDLLVQACLVTVNQAGTMLQKMAIANPRLAPNDYDERKERWHL